MEVHQHMTDHRIWHVLPLGSSWTVEEDGGGSPSSALFGSKGEALEQAADLIRAHPTATIIVHRADGSVEGETQPGRPLFLVQG